MILKILQIGFFVSGNKIISSTNYERQIFRLNERGDGNLFSLHFNELVKTRCHDTDFLIE